MVFSERSRFGLVLPLMALVCISFSHGQSLQHRKPQDKSPSKSLETLPISKPAAPALPIGTSLQVETSTNYSMKLGETIEGKLIYPIYADGRLVVPANASVVGKVSALEPDTGMRWHARLRGDFTPFHKVHVRFDEIEMSGNKYPISTEIASDGAPVLRLTTPSATPKRSFIARTWSQAKEKLHDQVAFITAPGKKDRALQMLYHQLPYHPERIEAHTAWSFELTAPLTLPGPSVPGVVAPDDKQAFSPTAPGKKTETWVVHALLMQGLSSAHAHPGDAVQALVVEPLYDVDCKLAIPQGSKLVGKVTTARAARSFGRSGKLRFTFQQVEFPDGFNRPVQGSLAGAATEKAQNLSLDAEGTISPRNQSSAIAPLLLTLLAGRALDQDGILTVQTGVASNGFGLIGRIVGVAAGNRNLAAGIGFYAAGLSFYENFLRPGRDVVFAKDTRIEIETSPLRAPVLAPAGTSPE